MVEDGTREVVKKCLVEKSGRAPFRSRSSRRSLGSFNGFEISRSCSRRSAGAGITVPMVLPRLLERFLRRMAKPAGSARELLPGGARRISRGVTRRGYDYPGYPWRCSHAVRTFLTAHFARYVLDEGAGKNQL